jgi:hypothetical protein
MQIKSRKFQGRVKTWLFMMDRELKLGENKELNQAFRDLRKKIQSDDGFEVPALTSGESEIIEINGMMFWVNCRKQNDGVVNVFVSSRRKPL